MPLETFIFRIASALVAGIIIRFLICMIVLYAAVCFLVPHLWSART